MIVSRGILLLAATLAMFCNVAFAIEAKCSACKLVADTLTEKLEKEKPRNSLDMRGRLDGQGNRIGEIIKYRDSELRFVEMFENLCDDLKVVALSNLTEGGPKEWVKKSANVPAKVVFSGSKNKEDVKSLQHYCHSVVEEHEEDLIGLIKEDQHKDESLSDLLCKVLSKACREKPKKKEKKPLKSEL
uniref:DUF3456 domain-containing protein n=1 Tax=Pyramimonas obovata TaxID=1411642 RepID=A0A7S0WFP3_9CHLO|mmetsp:Transcript_24460/g.53374  ORF Transcript_24460/g.53374 Transcript_24460/m.53374 type:complete len:187 (+) Transcript_24460:57-617(+)|eukprot:CAMPEP_0118935838 /NCGR_PEP_ID=MMETSP1169-20130426/15857_1 /TAXON_ID=36882 /ORGANISM="Pyramimonas obovata, Strain CCMP722" /LENGTH=186 /DNA_ID=CAMNT_0006878905 /DNA_START=57 /DNA_END=617 /DNA_ORIENTATION=-